MTEAPAPESPATPPARRIGVFVCQCGGNISDYVDTEKLRSALAGEGTVAHAEVQMFACSDAGQQAIERAIREQHLDGIVVASCSPKLHTLTFRGAARRAGLNPFVYTQANIREQDSWAHTHDRAGATEKAIAITGAALEHTLGAHPLEPLRTETAPSALVIGAGVAGLRSALALADLGLSVHLIERAEEPGGQVARWAKLFPNQRDGPGLIRSLLEEVRRRENIVLFTGAELLSKEGHIGAFRVRVRTSTGEEVPLTVGAILVATGFEPYAPAPGEFGYGLEGVLTLPEFEEWIGGGTGPLLYRGRPVRRIAYVYCVGSRQPEGSAHGVPYCSRYCCSATSFGAIRAHARSPELAQYHLFRDIRTYGKYELLYEEARAKGSLYLRYAEDAPPTVERAAEGLSVRLRDTLTGGAEVELPVDLVVLVTGMVPRENARLSEVLKLPVGADGFLHEIHQKLRPVETVVDGVFVAGAAQGPKNVAESVASALAAVSKTAGLLLKGSVELDPLVARVDAARCTGCGACLPACPYGALEEATVEGRRVVRVVPVLCKGEGACVPVCGPEAIEVEGYTHAQMRSMISALAGGP